PALPRRVRGIEGAIDVLRVRARNLAKGLAGHGGDIFKILAGGGFDPLASDVVAVARAEAHAVAELARMCCCQGRHLESALRGEVVAEGLAWARPCRRRTGGGQPAVSLQRLLKQSL